MRLFRQKGITISVQTAPPFSEWLCNVLKSLPTALKLFNNSFQ